MQCPQCQFENVDGAKFCNECGSQLEISCSKCGKPNPPGSKFCNECGHALDVPDQTPFKDSSFDEKLIKIQKYLPKGLTDKILSQKDRIEGERKQITVLFCDMEGFTALSERIGPDDAYSIIRERVPLPRILGRICMHPCEDVCRRKELNSSVSICALKRFVSDECSINDRFYKKNENNEKSKKIAIIGAGPAGLSASFYLRKKGYKIVLYEEKNKAGPAL